jgi:hypothetical protein
MPQLGRVSHCQPCHCDASVVRGIGVLPVFAGVLGLLLLVGSLAATWLREGR